MMTLNRRRLFIFIGVLITAVYLYLFLRSVSFGVLATDSAKYALNIAVPHPPLGRWLMVASQWIFGHTDFAARLPSFLADVFSFWLFFKLILKREKYLPLLIFFFIAINPAVIYWMGQGYQTSFISCAIALIAYGAVKEPRIGFFWIFAGYMFAIWTQLQGLLLFPVVCMLFWQALHEKTLQIRRNDTTLWLFIFTAAHSGLVILWLLTNPLSIADALSLAHRVSSSSMVGRIIELFQADFGRLLIVALITGLLSFIAKKEQRFRKATFLLGLSIFSIYFFKNPASYYTPYVFALASWSVLELDLPKRWMNFSILLVVVAVFVIDVRIVMPKLTYTSSYFRIEDVNALQTIVSKYPEDSMALGNFGYEWNYFLQKRFVRFTTNRVIQDKTRAAFVFVPQTLSQNELNFLSIFSHRSHVGAVDIYER
ncbi:MAG: hypothetical protein ABIB04_03165 [Patescibacteria group bacterium]